MTRQPERVNARLFSPAARGPPGYNSNALAVLELRSLFVLLEHVIGELKYLHYGLAAVLGFSAMKLATARWIEISPVVSIGIIVGCIGATIWPSVRALNRLRREAQRRDLDRAT
jgi:tellurite resistance protein TerC